MQIEEKNLACNLSARKYSEEALIIIILIYKCTAEDAENKPRKLKIIHLAIGLMFCWINQSNPRPRKCISILNRQRGDLYHEPIDTCTLNNERNTQGSTCLLCSSNDG